MDERPPSCPELLFRAEFEAAAMEPDPEDSPGDAEDPGPEVPQPTPSCPELLRRAAIEAYDLAVQASLEALRSPSVEKQPEHTWRPATSSNPGIWLALAEIIPVRHGRRRPSYARLKQMAAPGGIKRISGPDTLDGLTEGCLILPSALAASAPEENPYSLDAWIASQRETLRREGLETIPAARTAASVASIPAWKPASRLDQEIDKVLSEVDPSGFTPDLVDAVTGLIRQLASGTRQQRRA